MRSGNGAGGWRIWASRVGIGLLFFILGFGAGPASVQAFDADNLVNAVDISHRSGTITDAEVACWRVRAENEVGVGEWSSWSLFYFI